MNLARTRLLLFEMDAPMRALERQAAGGDAEAQSRLNIARMRVGDFRGHLGHFEDTSHRAHHLDYDKHKADYRDAFERLWAEADRQGVNPGHHMPRREGESAADHLWRLRDVFSPTRESYGVHWNQDNEGHFYPYEERPGWHGGVERIWPSSDHAETRAHQFADAIRTHYPNARVNVLGSRSATGGGRSYRVTYHVPHPEREGDYVSFADSDHTMHRHSKYYFV